MQDQGFAQPLAAAGSQRLWGVRSLRASSCSPAAAGRDESGLMKEHTFVWCKPALCHLGFTTTGDAARLEASPVISFSYFVNRK